MRTLLVVTRERMRKLLALVVMVVMVPTAAAEVPLRVYTVNYPLKFFAQRIGAEHVEVVLPVPGGEDPAFWRPSPEHIIAYQSADVILLNGADYARWVSTATLPRRALVDTSREFADRLLAVEDVAHAHGPGGAHSHGKLAFTTWLDPTQAMAQAAAIKAAFVRARPALAGQFERGLAILRDELQMLDAALADLVQLAPNRPLLGSHPVYQYLARRYDLVLESVHWEPEQVPDERAWTELSAVLKRHPAAWMLWEQAPLPTTVQRLRDMGIESVVFSPCANVPERGDFLSVMGANVDSLRRALSDAR